MPETPDPGVRDFFWGANIAPTRHDSGDISVTLLTDGRVDYTRRVHKDAPYPMLLAHAPIHTSHFRGTVEEFLKHVAEKVRSCCEPVE